nr:SET and MYND domain-containing protein 4-like isoform X1 [Osmia lignaria]
MEGGEERYRNLCSSETLRSGKKGFFSEFGERVALVAGDRWIAKVFARLTNDEDRIRAIFTEPKINSVALETLNRTEPLYRAKDATASRKSRLEGFVAATAAKRTNALLCFSQAVLRAPLTGKCEEVDRGFTLSLALLARAEILAASGQHALALDDLRFAEELTVPQQFKSELARKKEACEKVIRENEKSLVSAKELERRGEWTTTESKPLPPLTEGENPGIPGASSLLEMEETVSAGKRAIAAKTIVPGDTLVVEHPIAAALLPDFFGTHCQHCFSRSVFLLPPFSLTSTTVGGNRFRFVAPVGCPNCSGVAFCGRKCRDAAMSSYHKYECKILALLIGSGMSVLSMLALRMVTQNGPNKCAEIRHALTCRTSNEGEDRNARSSTETKPSKSAKRRSRKKKWRDSQRREKLEEDIDLRAYDLVAHEKQRSAKDFFERSLMAAFMLRCLQRVGFFEKPTKDEETPNEEEIGVAALLSKHLQMLQFNAHEVFETRLGTEHWFRGSKPVYLGVAVYPTVARFNHDCYPAVTRYFVGRSIVIRAIRRLEPGDVVAENYGPIFTKRTLKERQNTLAGRYWFRCECTACREDWPLFDGLSNDLVRLRCPTKGCTKVHGTPQDPNKMIKCSSCRREVDLRGSLETVRECETLYARGFAAMDREQAEAALQAFLEGADKFHRVAVPPHKDTHLAEIAASVCMADNGNVWSPQNPPV